MPVRHVFRAHIPVQTPKLPVCSHCSAVQNRTCITYATVCAAIACVARRVRVWSLFVLQKVTIFKLPACQFAPPYPTPFRAQHLSCRSRNVNRCSPLRWLSVGQREALTTKDTKSTKVEFDELPNRVIGCAVDIYRYPGAATARIGQRTMLGPCMASDVSFSDSFVLFVCFVVK